MKTLDELTETEETQRGKLAAEVLKLRRDREYKDRWQTRWGTKTDLGLFRTLKRLVLDGENHNPKDKMKLKIELNMDNAAFDEGGNGNECARILKMFATKIETVRLEPHPLLDVLRDANGNTVGKASVTK